MKRKKAMESTHEMAFFHEATKEQVVEFFREEIKEMHWVEKHHQEMLLSTKEELNCPILRNALGKQIHHTKERLLLLEEVFRLFQFDLYERKCEAIDKHIKESKSIILSDTNPSMQRDVCLIFVARKITHFKIAMYLSLALFSERLGNHEAYVILNRIVVEEQGDDKWLTSIEEKALFFEVGAEVI